MKVPHNFLVLLSAFANESARYLVIGGYAVGVHARPRTTKDLDVWLDSAKANIARAAAALQAFGAPPGIVDELRTAKPSEIVWFGRIPFRIDLLLEIPGVTFDTAWDRRTQVEIEGVTVQVIGREDLIANKRAVGRPQDRRDVKALTAKRTPRRRTKP